MLSKDNFLKEVEFTNSRGLTMKLHAIPPYLAQMAMTAIPQPSVPTYTVQLEGGGEEVHQHDEDSISQSGPAEKALWLAYKSDLQDAERAASDALLNVILIEGLEVELDLPKMVKRMKMMSIRIPEDPDEMELMVKKAYVIGGQEDVERITTLVMNLSGVSNDTLEQTKDTFQDTMESGS